MTVNLIEKLMSSFNELDRCINVTLDIFASKGEIPAEIIRRVQQYATIVEKQKELALSLESNIKDQNWLEVARLVKVINGLSAMIRDDAVAILQAASGQTEAPTEEHTYC